MISARSSRVSPEIVAKHLETASGITPEAIPSLPLTSRRRRAWTKTLMKKSAKGVFQQRFITHNSLQRTRGLLFRRSPDHLLDDIPAHMKKITTFWDMMCDVFKLETNVKRNSGWCLSASPGDALHKLCKKDWATNGGNFTVYFMSILIAVGRKLEPTYSWACFWERGTSLLLWGNWEKCWH